MSGVSKSGITTDAQTGERYIPSSMRSDGSQRKKIRVRPGYEPPEDVKPYRNPAAAAWKSRANAGVPGANASSGKKEIPKVNTPGVLMPASTNNAKCHEAKQAINTGVRSKNWRAPPPKQEEPVQEPVQIQEPVDVEAENAKKARNLKKKLRQARDLREKKEQGEGLLPEQLDKIIKIQELVRQLEGLGFDSNGDKRTGENA